MFLIRLLLSFRKDGITHYRVRKEGTYYDLYGGKQFESLPKLVEYYEENTVTINKKKVQLKHPVKYRRLEKQLVDLLRHVGQCGKA